MVESTNNLLKIVALLKIWIHRFNKLKNFTKLNEKKPLKSGIFQAFIELILFRPLFPFYNPWKYQKSWWIKTHINLIDHHLFQPPVFALIVFFIFLHWFLLKWKSNSKLLLVNIFAPGITRRVWPSEKNDFSCVLTLKIVASR